MKISLGAFVFAVLTLIAFISSAQTSTDYLNSGIQKAKAYDHEGAILDFNKAIQLDSMNAQAYYHRSWEKMIFSNAGSALEDLNKAIEIDPNYAEAYYRRGIAKHSLTMYDEACADFKKAKELGSKYPNPDEGRCK